MRRVLRPLPLPSSATVTSCGRCSTISAACAASRRSSARVTPYSGKTVITSKRAEPTSSYRYFDGSSFCGVWVSPARTSAAKAARRSGDASCERAGWVMLAPVVTYDERDCLPGGGMRGETRVTHAVGGKLTGPWDCLCRPDWFMLRKLSRTSLQTACETFSARFALESRVATYPRVVDQNR